MIRKLLLALLAVGAVTALLGINSIAQWNDSEPAKADIGKVLDLEGGDLQVRDRGPKDKPAIVLLHCFTCSIHYWTPLERLLERDHRVISIDLIGHGGSEKPDSRSEYTIERSSEQVERALEALGVRRAIVAGQSLGGSVAVGLTERAPTLVRGVVVMDTPPDPDFIDLPVAARLGFVPMIGPALMRIVPDAMIRNGVSDAFAGGFDVPDQFVEDVRRMTYPSYDSSSAASADYSEERALDERLAATGKQLLVIFGAEDDILEPGGEKPYRDIPGARVELLPGVGHTPQMETPRTVDRLIRQFEGTLRAGAATG